MHYQPTDVKMKLHIRDSAVALHCCKTHVKISRKIGNSTPCKIIPHKNIILKLCIRDYVGVLPAMQILVSIGAVGVSLHIGEQQHFDFFGLSCPVLTLFSRSCAQVEPLDRFSHFMARTTCFRTRTVLLGLERWVTIFGEVCLQKPPKWACA